MILFPYCVSRLYYVKFSYFVKLCLWLELMLSMANYIFLQQLSSLGLNIFCEMEYPLVLGLKNFKKMKTHWDWVKFT